MPASICDNYFLIKELNSGSLLICHLEQIYRNCSKNNIYALEKYRLTVPENQKEPILAGTRQVLVLSKVF